jgi:peroxiredoxin
VQLQAKLNEFKKLKAGVIGISADNSQTAQSTKASLGLSFDVLPDPDKNIIRLYSVLHPKEGIARPAVFIIDKKGVVRYRKIGKDAADRPKTALLLNVLRWL